MPHHGLNCYTVPVGGIRKVGRTPKVYEPTNAKVHISIPAREHELLADILIDALLTEDQEKSGREAPFQIARHRSAKLGAAERERARRGRLSVERALTLATAILTRYGFEPDRVTPTLLRLRNCPFAPLPAKAPQLVCGINHVFLTGFLNTLQASTLTAVLTPGPNGCCVELTPANPYPAIRQFYCVSVIATTKVSDFCPQRAAPTSRGPHSTPCPFTGESR
jgi:predicted ArsR family transcriptional regulator